MRCDVRKQSFTDPVEYLKQLWKREYPEQGLGLITSCQWETHRVPLKSLRCDPPRDMAKARRYYKALAAGQADFPPLVCINGMVIDGQHRFWAYRKFGTQMVSIIQNKPWELHMA